MKKISDKRRKQNQEYLKIRAEILASNPICPVTNQPATEIHHMKGRTGTLLTDRKYMLPVSREGHVWIEMNPEEAKAKGWSLSRLSKD